MVGVLSGGSFEPMDIVLTLAKVVAFFGLAVLLGRYAYPRFTLPFRSEGGKGFTFILMVAIAAGLMAVFGPDIAYLSVFIGLLGSLAAGMGTMRYSDTLNAERLSSTKRNDDA